MANGKEKSWLERIGCEISAWTSDVSAHPFAQIAVVVVCGLWFALGLATDILTAVLSILAISLTQMVLNRQNEREAEAHRRDVAMHAKLDELVIASRRARNEVAGIEEELDEEEIEELKHHAIEAIEEAEADGSHDARREAREAVSEITERVVKKRQKAAAAQPKRVTAKAK